ncbi:sulfur carrier protein ThiS [Undibacterium sp. Jales W-56]|uniref:sulfur carrier protein ThiS n=1 Tax=Undibacterium sp. Jales W-56 TaxID=2897325 RepID=UPI0021CF0772|nr:sulfur carrier protein ThiS [Undibacterium sp. Jales W-56]MCU6434788.1 sulfur carrier protein ThiS [Undibacterium sp. Jales W-56]
MTEIVLNGENYQLDQEKNLAELIATLNLSGQAIAVAVNRQIVARAQWASHRLQAQDKVDVVRAIGGG